MLEFRPIPFYFITTVEPEDLTPEACRRAMRDLADAGYGGCILFNKPPLGFDRQSYLSDFWFDTLENFILAGRELGLEMWINDGFDFPPGDAAGRIEAADPTLRQQRLRLRADGEVEVVEMPWGFPAFELPESSELFLELVYEAHRRRLGQYFGNGLAGFFSDCDNRRVSVFSVKKLEDGRYFPWSRNFSTEFRKRRGYEIEPHLAEILRGGDPDAQADYWQTAGELYQAWFAGNHAWCRAHGLKYTFHTSDTGPLTEQYCRRTSIGSEGDPFALFRHSDFPGTDHELALLDGGTPYDARYRVPVKIWGAPGKAGYHDFADTRHDVRAKYASSASCMQGAERTLCEMFAATNFSTDYRELRRIAMWQIMMGINFIVPHAVHHRFRGTTKFFAPPEFLHTALRNGLAEFNAFLAKACRIASAGKYCAAVALTAPTRDLWRGGEASAVNFFALCDRLNRSAVGYVVVTPEYLAEHRGDFALAIDPADWDGSLELAPLPGGDVRFSGGELCFMRRRCDDGSEFLIAANLWSDVELVGELVWQGRSYTVALAPGEYAVFGGEFECFRAPDSGATVLRLPMVAQAEFDEPQRIPLEAPDCVDGAAREFRWRAAVELPPLFLEWPEAQSGEIFCDGVPVRAERKFRCFDDPYCEAALPASASRPGEHLLRFTGEAEPRQPARLRGDVELSLWTDVPGDKLPGTYNLNIVAPRRKELILSPRRGTLVAGMPLGEQGELFYDGATRWHWRFTLPEAVSLLDLGATRGVCDVIADGGKPMRLIAEPYLAPVRLAAGEHELEVVLYGSPGALLEGGNAEVLLGDPIRLLR